MVRTFPTTRARNPHPVRPFSPYIDRAERSLEAFETVHARCEACGMVSDLEVLEDTFAVCTLCETTNRWVKMQLPDDTEIVLTGL